MHWIPGCAASTSASSMGLSSTKITSPAPMFQVSENARLYWNWISIASAPRTERRVRPGSSEKIASAECGFDDFGVVLTGHSYQGSLFGEGCQQILIECSKWWWPLKSQPIPSGPTSPTMPFQSVSSRSVTIPFFGDAGGEETDARIGERVDKRHRVRKSDQQIRLQIEASGGRRLLLHHGRLLSVAPSANAKAAS